ncbi:hypothetical protein C5B85_15690 [Pseudoclavibacter sp. AY1F1]|uniref:GAF domain-containing protein n=1 Tax=Pseudoclavibacter sp. AY1F1 TaxID=2080583 RepID=UPI000CE93444|nr:GAF domain-containing protein [Pseudoclavibacter sp. AY1F1]PPF42711.1 hypothetical protein C5B85_15690 [Pseudoclavibacter sp. AY1F1]
MTAIVPVLLTLIGGAVLRRTMLRSGEFWSGLERLTYYVLGPALFVTSRKPVLTENLAALPAHRWSAFRDAVSREQVGALFAFPMFVGPLPIGAVDMYSSTPSGFSPMQVRQAVVLADLLAKLVLRLSQASAADAPKEDRWRSHRVQGALVSHGPRGSRYPSGQ